MFVYVEDVSCCSAVCLCCAADKRAYMICNQFIEPAVSGGGGKGRRRSGSPRFRRQRRCQYWSTVTLTGHECSPCGGGEAPFQVLSALFRSSLESVERKEEKLEGRSAGEKAKGWCAERKPRCATADQPVFLFAFPPQVYAKVTQHTLSSSLHSLSAPAAPDLMPPPRLAPPLLI